MRTITPALVIGGGIAGAALATHLAQAGRRVLLVERRNGPHDKVCGEFVNCPAKPARSVRPAGARSAARRARRRDPG